MKKNLYLAMMLAIVTLVAATISCSKSNNQAANNYYTYDGQRFDIVWAGYHYSNEGTPDAGYEFGISATALVDKMYDEPNCFEFTCPESVLGLKLDLNVEHLGVWIGGYFRYYGAEYQYSDDNQGISGSDNWVKVTKNSENNFTFEFSMTINGKLLEGKYSGKFQKVDGCIIAC